MNTLKLNHDRLFYPALFVLWSTLMLATHSEYRYFGTPLRSEAGADSPASSIQGQATLAATIDELRISLLEVKVNSERMHIEHNLGIAYYDLFKTNRSRRDLLDSARVYIDRSVSSLPAIGRFYYNYGRLFTELGDHSNAARLYDKAIAVDPNHVLALHNMGLVTYFELHKPREARRYFNMALEKERILPMCNYVLGEIALELNEYREALAHFEAEIFAIEHRNQSKTSLPVSSGSLAYALTMAHMQLANLYSTRFVDQEKAQAHYHSFLRLEKDEARRAEMTKRMQKFWVVKK